MVISEMTEAECREALAAGRVARLGCSRDDQAYVVPIYYAYDQAPDGTPFLYGFTTAGQKVEWMRANPRVCVEWDEVTHYDRWASIVAFGRYEELTPPPRGYEGGISGRGADRADPTEEQGEWLRATDLLRRHTTWWQPGGAAFTARNHHDPPRTVPGRVLPDSSGADDGTPGDPRFHPAAVAAPGRGGRIQP